MPRATLADGSILWASTQQRLDIMLASGEAAANEQRIFGAQIRNLGQPFREPAIASREIHGTNLFTGKPLTWNPATEGFFALVPLEKLLTKDATGNFSKSYLCLSGVGHKTAEAACAELALIEAQYPEVAGKIKICKQPCSLSTLECWIDVDVVPTAEQRNDAAATASRIKNSAMGWAFRDEYMSRWGMSAVFM